MWLTLQAVETLSPAHHQGEGAQCARRVAHKPCASRRHDPHAHRGTTAEVTPGSKYMCILLQRHFTGGAQLCGRDWRSAYKGSEGHGKG